MPMPQLKVRTMSASATPPSRASQAKTAGSAQDTPSISIPTPGGSTRGRFSISPPPVMWASAFTRPARCAAKQDVT